MINKLILLADIHIKVDNSRTNEYEIIFNKLINELKKIEDIKDSRIVILGDTIDKVKFDSQTIVLFISLIKQLIQLTKVIIILGLNAYKLCHGCVI